MLVLLGVIFLSLGVIRVKENEPFDVALRRFKRHFARNAALDALRTELARLIAGEEHHTTGFFGEFFEHGTPFRVRDGAGARMVPERSTRVAPSGTLVPFRLGRMGLRRYPGRLGGRHEPG